MTSRSSEGQHGKLDLIGFSALISSQNVLGAYLDAWKYYRPMSVIFPDVKTRLHGAVNPFHLQ